MASDIVEHADGPGPYGSKGMSEGALLPVAPAVAAAVDRCDRRGHPRPAAHAGTGLAGPARRRGGIDPMTHTRSIAEPLGDSLAEARALVGGKAANLGVMVRDLGLPVPPAFAITTATCRTFLADGWPDGLDAELRARMAELEAAVGRGFGDAADPLLVSVRSGAPVSMPGMMDTILNLGLTEATTAGLARASGDDAFARSCRERFVASFRDIVGVDDVPDDPWVQLRLAIEAVFRSWDSDRAIAYRRREGLPDDLGTAVTVQAMVFGNRGATSATGVLFTRDPATGEPRLYGDMLFDAQGEDVVAGTHRTESIDALDARLPTVAAELREAATRLERHYADLCDIEFTIEQGRLWMLQVRVGKRSPQAALRIAVDMAEDPDFPLTRAEAVARVAPLLADPPTMATSRADTGPPLAHRPAGLAGRRERRDRDERRCRPGRRGGRPDPDPRPGRHLARRRPRHGPFGRHPHRARRAGVPCRGRGARLGHPRGRRRGRAGGPRRRGADRRADAAGRRGHHHRRRDRRGVRGRRRRDHGGRAGGPDAARLGRGTRHRDPRTRGRCRRHLGVPRSGTPRRARPVHRRRRDPRRLHPRPRDQGLRDDRGHRRRLPLHARTP